MTDDDREGLSSPGRLGALRRKSLPRQRSSGSSAFGELEHSPFVLGAAHRPRGTPVDDHSSDSRAGATVDLLFVGRNGSAIAPTASVDALPGDALTMAVRMRNDEAITIAVFSLNYDLDGDNELDVVSALQWIGLAINATGTDRFEPSNPAAFSVTPTFVGSFQGATTNLSLPRRLPPAGGAFAGGYQMGTVIWKVNAGVNNDGADIVSGILNFGVDAFADAAFNLMDARVQFNAATVNIPEPGTACLLGLGLVGLVLLGRRRSSPEVDAAGGGRPGQPGETR